MNRSRVGSLVSVFLTFAVLSAPGQESPDAPRASLLRSREEAAVEWLIRRKVPNDTVESPVALRRNLVISYELPEDDPARAYQGGRAYLYDSALAAVAFAMTDRYDEAEEVLLALSRQPRADGSLWFGVNTHNEWPGEEDSSGATIRSGASAWAAYAAVFYLRKRELEASGFSGQDRVGRTLLAFAEKTARHLLSLQVSDAGDGRRGLVTGGRGTYELEARADGSVESVYLDEELGWASAEHNIDAYFLFRDLAILTGDDEYGRAAQAVLEGVLTLWDKKSGQMIQGIKETGKRDTVLPLDTASWGSILLRQAGQTRKADASLESAMRRFRIGDTWHFRPYADDPVYTDEAVAKAYLGKPSVAWNDLDMAWPEGSLGVAAALIKAGRITEAERVILASLDYSTAGGALLYASREVPHQFSAYPSAASTAWFVIAVENLLDPRDRDLFWGPE